MIGWLVAITIYGIGGLWMLRTVYEVEGLETRGERVLALVVVTLWPAYVLLGETCIWLGGCDES